MEKPASTKIKSGENLILEVLAVGNPVPQITWLKDNVLLLPDKHTNFQMEAFEGRGHLIIDDADKSHDGWYTITAINKAGRDQVRCRVTVDVEEASEVQDHGRKFKIQKTRKSSTQENGSPPLPRASGKVAKAFDAEVDERDMYDPSEQRKPTFKKKIENVKVILYHSQERHHHHHRF